MPSKKIAKAVIEAIKIYQEPGSVEDFDEKNFRQEGWGLEWSDHVPGTWIMPHVGLVFLGMPKGFCRLGPWEKMPINIFIGYGGMQGETFYDKFNVPVWKYLDEHNNTLVRGLIPRLNKPFLHVILGDWRSKIDCLEITSEDLKSMD